MESCCRLHRDLSRLHQLLRNADGRSLEAMPVDKYTGLTRRSGGRAVWTGQIKLDEKSLDTPRTWKRSKRIFVNSMSDLFHDDVTETFIGRVWRVMDTTALVSDLDETASAHG